jgi:NADH-quinone oxidoreductase subunit J
MQTAVFIICSLICLSGAAGVIWSRNPVHSALSLVATLFGVAVLFLNQDAQLLGAVQVIVYTGAIVVLILFVMMLLGVDREQDLDTEPLVGQRVLAGIGATVVFLALFGVFMVGGANVVTGQQSVTEALAVDEPNINQIGRLLFTDFVFAFEITAALLTIAVVGAVVLSRRARHPQPLPEPEPLDDPESTEVAQ